MPRSQLEIKDELETTFAEMETNNITYEEIGICDELIRQLKNPGAYAGKFLVLMAQSNYHQVYTLPIQSLLNYLKENCLFNDLVLDIINTALQDELDKQVCHYSNVLELLKIGANSKLKSEKGKPILHCVLNSLNDNSIQHVSELLSLVHIDDKDSRGRDIITYAIETYPDILHYGFTTVHALLRAGGNINATDKKGNNLIHLLYSNDNDYETAPRYIKFKLEILVKAGVNINHVNAKQETALQIAKNQGRPMHIFEELQKNGASLDEALRACLKQEPFQLENAIFLAELGAKFDNRDMVNKDGLDLELILISKNKLNLVSGRGPYSELLDKLAHLKSKRRNVSHDQLQVSAQIARQSGLGFTLNFGSSTSTEAAKTKSSTNCIGNNNHL